MTADASMVYTPPPSPVIAAFNLDISNPPVHLPGGQGTSFLFSSDSIVLKPATDSSESELISRVLSQLRRHNSSFRVSSPLKSTNNHFVFNGWTASEYIPLARSLDHNTDYTLDRWREILHASRVFHNSLRSVPVCDADLRVLRQRTHAWARADRVIWGEEAFIPPSSPPASFESSASMADLMDLVRRLNALRPTLDTEEVCDELGPPQLVHGDLVSGQNILFSSPDEHLDIASSSPALPPAIIDFSPYFRPVEFAEGILVADGLLYCGAGSELAELVGTSTMRLEMLRRGLLFRVLVGLELGHEGHAKRGVEVLEECVERMRLKGEE